MAKIDSNMRTIFENQLAVIATASKDGTPNVVPKGSLRVIDDETLVYSEGAGRKTLENLQQNPKAAVMVVDREKGNGYQVKGAAEILTSGQLFEQVAKRAEAIGRPRPQNVVKIKVEEIYSLRPSISPQKND